MKNEPRNEGRATTKDTTQRLFPTAAYNFRTTTLKTLPQAKPITPEELRAVTRDGKDVIYVALAHVALSRGMWVLKEAAQ